MEEVRLKQTILQQWFIRRSGAKADHTTSVSQPVVHIEEVARVGLMQTILQQYPSLMVENPGLYYSRHERLWILSALSAPAKRPPAPA